MHTHETTQMLQNIQNLGIFFPFQKPNLTQCLLHCYFPCSTYCSFISSFRGLVFLILYRKSELKCTYSAPFDYIPERAQTIAFSSHMCIANWVEMQVQNCPVAISSGRKARTEAREGLWPAKPNRWFGFFLMQRRIATYVQWVPRILFFSQLVTVLQG